MHPDFGRAEWDGTAHRAPLIIVQLYLQAWYLKELDEGTFT